MSDLQSAYRALYHAYTQLNRVCWQGSLPQCALLTSRRMRNVLGRAYRCIPYRIKLNATALMQGPDEFFLSVLAHEMTHIWQYVHGSRGGHGVDFKREMLRIGIDESTGRGQQDSSFGYCVRQRRLFQQNGAAALQVIYQSRLPAGREFDFFLQNHHQLFQ